MYRVRFLFVSITARKHDHAYVPDVRIAWTGYKAYVLSSLILSN